MTVRKVCAQASKYQGVNKPTCGCDYCVSVWEEKQIFHMKKLEAPTGKIFKFKKR